MKAQLSLNTIIIAAVVLIVLVVLWSIFAGRMGTFTSGLAECKGKCKLKSECLAVAHEGHKKCLDEGVSVVSTIGEVQRIEISAPSLNDPMVCCLMKR